jgi:transposase
MGRKADITDFVKGQITALKAEGYSQSVIATRLGISRCAVQNALREPAADGLPRRSKTGRIRKTTARQDRYLKTIIVRSPHASCARIAQDARDHNIDVSVRTVRRRLSDEFKLVARRPAKKPLMTKKQRLARVTFCKEMRSKTADWWERVMFTDESTFSQVRGAGSNYVRRPVGHRLDPKYTLKTVKHPPSVMVWGGITAAGRCGLQVFGKGVKVNAAKYIEVLDAKVKIHMQISGATVFQQDSAPCHTAKVVKKWFADNKVKLLQSWPANSPDLNVIENCWQIMKRKVAAHHPTSEVDLVKVLKQVWTTEISAEYCKSLVRSMPMRIQAVLKNKGYPTKY